MAKAEAPDVVEVVGGFVCPSGEFHAGQLLRGDDPIVKKYPEHFRAVTLVSTVKAPEPIVEQATAAPGEKRAR